MPKQPLTKKQKEFLRKVKDAEPGALDIGGVAHGGTLKSLIGRGLIVLECGFVTLTFAGQAMVR